MPPSRGIIHWLDQQALKFSTYPSNAFRNYYRDSVQFNYYILYQKMVLVPWDLLDLSVILRLRHSERSEESRLLPPLSGVVMTNEKARNDELFNLLTN